MLTMGVGYACGACFTGRPTHHEPNEVNCSSFFRLSETPVHFLSPCEALFQVLVDDKVDHGLADSPPGSCETLPEAFYTALRMNPSYHRGKGRLATIKLQPGLDQPNGVGGTRTHKPWKFELMLMLDLIATC